MSISLTFLETHDMDLTPAALLAVQGATYQLTKAMTPTVIVTAQQRDSVLATLRETIGWEPTNPVEPVWNGIRITTSVEGDSA